jgi:hypothetical protein
MSAYPAPRRLNVVTILLLLGLAAGAYIGFKFGPVYWQRYKVDEVLTDIAFQAMDLRLATPAERAEEEVALVEKARGRILELGGIDADRLSVYFESDASLIHAEYSVVVHHPVLDPTELYFHRSVRVPGDDKVP